MGPSEEVTPSAGSTGRNVSIALRGALRRGYLATPTGQPWRSAVVVIGEEARLDDGAASVARRLALSGHGALAIGHGEVGPEGTLLANHTRWVDAALARLRAEAPGVPPRFGVVGYGLGGFIALVAGYRSQVGAAVAFYGAGPGRLRAELRRIIDRPKRHAAPFLLLLGIEDAAVRAEDLAALRERLDVFGMRHTFILYPRTRGAFCREGGPDYRGAEADDAWGRALHALETAPRLRNRSPPRSRAGGA